MAVKRVRIVAIVGSEGAKFTPATERLARAIIREQIAHADVVVSGACHLGGIDIWAVEEAQKLGKLFLQYPPRKFSWKYYRERNVKIAKACDRIVCITVRKLPPHFKGMRFPLCYHCKTTDHVKSGGCWTVNYARKLGKHGRIIVV